MKQQMMNTKVLTRGEQEKMGVRWSEKDEVKEFEVLTPDRSNAEDYDDFEVRLPLAYSSVVSLYLGSLV